MSYYNILNHVLLLSWWKNANLSKKRFYVRLNSFIEFAILFDATQIFMDPLLYFMSRNM